MELHGKYLDGTDDEIATHYYSSLRSFLEDHTNSSTIFNLPPILCNVLRSHRVITVLKHTEFALDTLYPNLVFAIF
jgi:hypothetical protein